MSGSISWTYSKLQALKRAQAAAITRGAESYLFEGHELLVDYARYLIEHLESIIPRSGPLNGYTPDPGGVEDFLRELDFQDLGGDRWLRRWRKSRVVVQILGDLVRIEWVDPVGDQLAAESFEIPEFEDRVETELVIMVERARLYDTEPRPVIRRRRTTFHGR